MGASSLPRFGSCPRHGISDILIRDSQVGQFGADRTGLVERYGGQNDAPIVVGDIEVFRTRIGGQYGLGYGQLVFGRQFHKH